MAELAFVYIEGDVRLRDLIAAVQDDVGAKGGEWFTRYVLVRDGDTYRGIHLPALSAAIESGEWSLETPLSEFPLSPCETIPVGEADERRLRNVRQPLAVAEQEGRPVALHSGLVARGAVRSDRRGWWRLVGKWMAERGEIPEWPDPLPASVAYKAILSIDLTTTLYELAEKLRGRDDDTMLAVQGESGQWAVLSAQSLLSRLANEYPDAAPGSMVGAFVDPDTAEIPYLTREETPWALIEEFLSGTRAGSVRYVIAEGGKPAGILSQLVTVRGVSKGVAPSAPDVSWSRFLQVSAQLAPSEADQGRVVNAWFADEQDKHVDHTRALAANRSYRLGVNIGAASSKAHVVGEQPALDARLVSYLIGEGQPLVLRVDSEDVIVLDAEREVSLPKGGSTEDVHFRIVTPVWTGLCRMRLGVYYENNLVQSYLIYVRVAPEQGEMPEGAGDGWWSVCEYTLSSDLSDLRELGPRRVCVWIGEGKEDTHRAGIAGAAGVDLGPAIEVNVGLATSALEHYRDLLYKTCFDPKSETPSYLYDKESHEPLAAETFEKRLLDLAELGQMLYERVFGTEVGRRIAEYLRGIEQTQPGLLVVQIARLSLDLAFPWAVLYDRPLRYNPRRNKVCERFLTEGTCGADCPHAQDDNVVCPSGFWGFRYIIEQPLRPPHAFSSVATRLPGGEQPELALVYGESLGLTQQHGDGVSAVIQARGHATVYADTAGLIDAMRKGPALVYFYCHGGNTPYRQWLVVKEDEPLMPSYLDDGFRSDWADGAPLVVLNGCHTGKYDPATLLSFVHRFGAIGAAGVIGTEIPIHEYLGDYFGRFLIDRLLGGEPVGQIVYDLRWELLKKRNLLGLVYAPYCYADLRIGS